MVGFDKILVANRGEIAIRVFRAATELGKRTVAIHSEQDTLSLHRAKADEAYLVGAGLAPISAYLDIDAIIDIARASGVDAIHPGYGLLSENPAFVDACDAAGIAFIGPTAETMRSLGDKAAGRQAAIAAGVPVVPASDVLPDEPVEIRRIADEMGYPLMLKASWGGGGRGMRMISGPDEVVEMVDAGRREAEAAFGNGEGFLEKLVVDARHVEVQILGDDHGGIYHLHERDCSIQRRHQKVVERAPAPYLDAEQREVLCGHAVDLCRHVGYRGAGTVEFLMDIASGSFHFIEVNPRLQVEHTVTEEITGVDIVQAQIRIAEGATVAEATGCATQADVPLFGHALQCRVTTEDPQNNFIPDYGRLTAYRTATGMGIRLDGGTAYAGAVVTRHYDSLLEKVTARGPTPDAAVRRLSRALREFRIRGVATNIAFVENLLQHPRFADNSYTTRFIDESPELFDFARRRDRATRLLTYVADVTVNGHPDVAGRPEPDPIAISASPTVHRFDGAPPPGTRQIFLERGAAGLAEWMAEQTRVLVTDTTMRDAHQSLLATRVRTCDMLDVAPLYAHTMSDLFSLECWGGATFDVAYRFLQESPWERLAALRDAVPNVLLQMLLRGSNGVGYTNLPDNVVRLFVERAAGAGVDVFRVFDSLNWVDNMTVAIDAVIETGAVCEATICYTGDLLDPDRQKYDLDYYLDMARRLEDTGAHVLGIKDMAGLLKPAAATVLFEALNDTVDIPVHFHTHDTSGVAAATVLAAVEAGVDAIDAAIDSMSGTTSQPNLGSIAAALRRTERDPGLDPDAIRVLSSRWEHVRRLYAPFESGSRSGASEVYLHEMPGGQFTNLKAQARSLGIEHRWDEVAEAYATANAIFGDIVKVTPTSKVVGDLALMMVLQDLTREQVESPDVELSFPESVVDMMRGDLGQPLGGWPEQIQAKVLRNDPASTARPGDHLSPVDLSAERERLDDTLARPLTGDDELCSSLMYPKVFETFVERQVEYGPVDILPTHTFFYGMSIGQQIECRLGPGKTLVISLQAIGDAREDGTVPVFFELNGLPRVIRVVDRDTVGTIEPRLRADPSDATHVPAPMPGAVGLVAVAEGDTVSEGDLLFTIEAMKMETAIVAERAGTIAAILISAGSQVEAQDLVARFEP
ncbi:pyruvate carboxylase [Ilumatobacter sp.]|uniref:pyruvate carboxylase n=1 Tax=Ilumatobacter sp. TaxID=1967498 RepID=UPI003B523FA5